MLGRQTVRHSASRVRSVPGYVPCISNDNPLGSHHPGASAAIQAALVITPNREEVFARMSAYIDETLNMGGPGRGDAHDEFNTQMRETARFQAMQSLDAIARMFRNPPGRG